MFQEQYESSSMSGLFLAILSTIFVSLLSLSGLLVLWLTKHRLHFTLIWLVALSAGTMLGAAFFHLLPELLENADVQHIFGGVAIAFVIFWGIERILHWRHCHDEECPEHTFGWMNLIGDAAHNFLDGLIIGSAYVVSIELGVITTLAIILHEIPQELGDFAVLLHAGWRPRIAVLANLLVALTSVIGAALGFIFASQSQAIGTTITMFAAGGFIYIAASDLIPELKQHNARLTDVAIFVSFLCGLAIMWFSAGME